MQVAYHGQTTMEFSPWQATRRAILSNGLHRYYRKSLGANDSLGKYCGYEVELVEK